MKAVVVHRGARDSYQVARALSDAGMLEKLVTDLAWNPDSVLNRVLPAQMRAALGCRDSGVPNGRISTAATSGLLSLGFEKAPVPFPWKRSAIRWNDRMLGKQAGILANRGNAALLSYSYYAHSAFTAYRGAHPRILFQAHPHPASVRVILQKELQQHPDCAASLLKEWELSLNEDDFQRLIAETQMAQVWIAASSFTRQTLIENGIDGAAVHVAPYGVDLQQFQPAGGFERDRQGPLRLLFAGTMNQRKGIRYLVDAVSSLNTTHVELRVCGRVVDQLEIFQKLGSRVRITPDVTRAELIEAYQEADLFVFPSVAEGFGQVILEALACGLPVLSTTRTAAVDLVREGRDGFVIEPGQTEGIAERIEWALANRSLLRGMREQARNRAEQFTWQRFRDRIVEIVRNTETHV
jgi:glycosyltransferase involved in cell wall biosynthesis